jgi:GNAT superfamily N-acetyltransferase
MTKLYRPAIALDGIDLRPMEPADEKQRFCDSQYALQDAHYRRHYADFELWAICNRGIVIGRLYLATFEGMFILMDITLAGSERGKGIGTALLHDILGQADTQQREMRLHVEPDNPARRLYQRMGFIDIGDAELYQEMRRLPVARSQ